MENKQSSMTRVENSSGSNLGRSDNATDSFEEVYRFLREVGMAAHKYGSTSTRLEAFLDGLSKRFGYTGVFRSNPSEIIFALSKGPDDPQRVEIISTPTGLNLDKLARLGEVVDQVKQDTLSLNKAFGIIDEIDQLPDPWGKFASMLGYALTGLGLAPLLGGSWADTLFATLFSILVYGMVLLSGRLGKAATEWLPLTSAFVVGVLATIIQLWVPELNLVLVILCAIAILLPGYTVSLGAGELVAQRVVSGMANLMNGLVTLIKQVAGGWLGIVVVSSIIPVVSGSPASPVSQTWVYALVPPLLAGLCLAFQVSKRDFLSAIMVCGIAYLGILFGSMLNANVGNLLGTIVAVVVSTLWARQTHRPTSIVLIPAIVLLVCGTIGFRGLASLAGGDVALGVQEFFQMFVVAMTLLAGMLIGFTIVRPENSL
jgi:uncharacterized membrane protein YjjP (DUF1212 family)